MNTASWILCGVIFVSLVLYVVFTFAKKIKIIQDISSVLIILCTGILNIIFLNLYTPDSYHILKLSTMAFSFIATLQILCIFENNKRLSIAAGIMLLLSLGSWVMLYKSTFYIYRVQTWINILASISYFVIFLLLFLIFIKKQSPVFYLFAVLYAILISFIHYSAFVSLCFLPEVYNIIKFIGITVFLGYVVFGMLTNSILNLKLKDFISFMILITAFVLIPLSNLMILN